jgi:hypothetical protein
MSATSQQFKGSDGALLTLNAAIDILNLAKDACGIPPAQAAFGAVSILLAVIRVSSLQFGGDGPLVHIYPGFHGQRTGLCRARAELRPDLFSARSGHEQEEVERPQRVFA